jgi:hypothetical protein
MKARGIRGIYHRGSPANRASSCSGESVLYARAGLLGGGYPREGSAVKARYRGERGAAQPAPQDR